MWIFSNFPSQLNMDNYEIWYNMKNNSLTFPPKFLLFPDYPENDTILPDFPVCVNPVLAMNALLLYQNISVQLLG